jgi:hypothetical protein
MQHEKEILKVRVRADLTIDYERVNVRRGAMDEIEWHTEGEPVIIDFDPDNKPFEKHSFEVTCDSPARSGPAVGGVGDYDYYVRSISLAQSADPGVNVKP